MMPTACRNEYMIVVPTNFMPRFLNSFEIVSDKGDEVLSHSWMTLPLVKLQMNLSNEPNLV